MSRHPRPVAEKRFDRSTSRGGAKVGVLPLTLTGTDENEAHLATGLAEEITSALARFRWMFLVSSSSIGQFLQDTRNEAALRRTFGLDFVLDGSIQRVGTRLRITIRLIDLRDGSQIVWGPPVRPADQRPANLARRGRGGGRGAD